MTTKNKDDIHVDELRDEYDLKKLGKGIRGKYLEQARAGTNLVLLDPDVARAFPTGQSVNEALRMLVKVAETSQSAKRAETTAPSST